MPKMGPYPNLNVHGFLRVGKQPEQKFTPGGKAITTFSGAVSRGKDDDKITDWWDCECWEKVAENVSENVSSGDLIYVEGRLTQDHWTDKNGGGQRSKPLITVNICYVVVKNPKFAGGDGEEAPRQVRQAAPAEDDEEIIPVA